MREYGHGSPAMRKNEPDVRKPGECPIDKKTVYRASRVEQELRGDRRHVWKKVGASLWGRGMNEHNGIATVKFLENGHVRGIAKPFVTVAS